MMKSTNLQTLLATLLSIGLATSAFADKPLSDVDWMNRHFGEVVRGPGAANDKDAILRSLNPNNSDAWVDKESKAETPVLKPAQAKKLVDSLRYMYDHQPRLVLIKNGAEDINHVRRQTGIMSMSASEKNYGSPGAVLFGQTNDNNEACSLERGQPERFGCDYADMVEHLEFSQKYDPKSGKWSARFEPGSTQALIVSKTSELLGSGDTMTQRFSKQIQNRIGEQLGEIMISVNENHDQPKEKVIAEKIDQIRNQVIAKQIRKDGGFDSETAPTEVLPKWADKKGIDWIDQNFSDVVQGPNATKDANVLLLALGKASAAEVPGDAPLLSKEKAQKVVSALQYLKNHKPPLVLVKEGALDQQKMHRDSQIGVITAEDFKNLYGSFAVVGTSKDNSSACPLENGGKEHVSCDFASLMSYMEFANKYDPKTQTWSPKFDEGSVGAQVVAETTKILESLNNPNRHDKRGVDNPDVVLIRRYSNLIRKKVGEHLSEIVLAVNESPGESVSEVVSKKVKEIQDHTINHEEKHGDSLN